MLPTRRAEALDAVVHLVGASIRCGAFPPGVALAIFSSPAVRELTPEVTAAAWAGEDVLARVAGRFRPGLRTFARDLALVAAVHPATGKLGSVSFRGVVEASDDHTESGVVGWSGGAEEDVAVRVSVD